MESFIRIEKIGYLLKFFWNIAIFCGLTGFFGLSSSAFSAKENPENAIIEQLNELEIKSNQVAKESQKKINQIASKMDRKKYPRAWLHALILSDDYEKKKIEFKNIESHMQEADEWSDVALLFRLIQMKVGELKANAASEAEVQKTFARAEGFCAENSSSVWCGRLYDHWAYYYHDMNSNAQALKQALKAISILELVRGKEIYYLHDAQSTLSTILQSTGQTEQAIKITKANYDWYDRGNFHGMAASEATNMSIYLSKIDLNNRDEILRWMDKAEKHANASDNPDRLSFINYSRARYLFKIGQYSASLPFAEAAEAAYIKDNIYDFAALTGVYKARSLIKLHRLNEASLALDKAIKIVPKTYQFEQMVILEARTELAKEQKKFDQAFGFLESYHKAWKDQKEEEQKRDMNRLNVEMGLKLEEQRNANLLKENEIQKQKAEVIRFFVIVLSLLFLLISFLAYKIHKNKLDQQETKMHLLKTELVEEIQARSSMAAKASHQNHQPLQLIARLSEKVEAAGERIQGVLEAFHPDKASRTAALEKLMEEFEAEFEVIQQQISGIKRVAKRADTVANELRIVSSIHGMGTQKVSIQKLWDHLVEEAHEDEMFQTFSAHFGGLNANLGPIEVFVDPDSFIRSIFYLLKEALEEITAGQIVAINLTMASHHDKFIGIELIATASSGLKLKGNKEWRELHFCRYLLKRYRVEINLGYDASKVKISLSIPTANLPKRSNAS